MRTLVQPDGAVTLQMKPDEARDLTQALVYATDTLPRSHPAFHTLEGLWYALANPSGATTPASVVALILKDGLVCAVSRRFKPHDLGLPGGKIDRGETPEQAVRRETLEEIGVTIGEASYCYQRVDKTDGRVAWCYRVTTWTGEPRQMEPGIEVSWVPPSRLLEPTCTFHEYNAGLFAALGLV